MANRLNIYACTGVGNSVPNVTFYKGEKGGNTLNNTQAYNTLLVKINLLRSELSCLELSDSDRKHLFNELVFYTACAQLYTTYNNKQLAQLGEVMGAIYPTMDCKTYNLDTEVAKVVSEAKSAMQSGNVGKAPVSPAVRMKKEFVSWWDANIVSRNKIGLNISLRDEIANKIGAVDNSWMQDKDLAEYLTKGSEYFLYLYFTDEQLAKLPKAFRAKANKQMATYDYCKDLFVDVYGSEQEMQDIITAGIIQYFGATPEAVCDDIANGKKTTSGIGLATEIIVALISAAVTLIVGVITAICSMVAQTKVAEYAAIDRKAIEQSTPNADDFDGLNVGGSTIGSSSWITWALLAVGAALILKRN